MKRIALIFLAILFLIQLSMAQDLTYDIVVKNKQVGEIQAKKYNRAGEVRYFLESEASFNLLFSLDYNYSVESTFSNDMLMRAFAENMINDKVKASSTTEYHGSGYTVNRIDKDKITINAPITFSMIGFTVWAIVV